MAMPLLTLSHDFALRQFQSGKQRGGPVAFVIVSHCLAAPFFIGRPGWVRSKAWI